MSRRVRHRVFGLTLDCDRALPRLAVEPEAGDEASGEVLAIDLGSVPPSLEETAGDAWRRVWKTDVTDDGGEPWLCLRRRGGGELYQLAFADGTRFFVDHEGRRLWASWPADYTLEDVESYLFSTVLGFVLRLRGIIALHASAVVIDGLAVALAGPAHAGKSTTAAAFAQLGCEVLTDDITVLQPAEDRYLVPPGRPELRLWQQSSELLGDLPEQLPRLSPTWDKRFLDLENHGYRSAGGARELAAVYLLDWRPESRAEPAIQELGGSSGLVALAANSYVAHLLDRQMRAEEFDFLTTLLHRLPVRQLTIPGGGLAPAEIRDLIAADFRRGRTTSPAAART